MYDQAFFDTIRSGCVTSADEVVPPVLHMLSKAPRSQDLLSAPLRVVDVGCGQGWWLMPFMERGCEVIGIDSPDTDGSLLGERFIPHNLRDPLPAHLRDRFDLAVSLEVAEHLPPSRAGQFVEDLCQLAPNILFSAAIPGQGGVGHINEQRPDYWVGRFRANGYSVSGGLRWWFWENDKVECWYRQNLLWCTRRPDDFPDLFGHPSSEPFTVVHPTIFDWRRPR